MGSSCNYGSFRKRGYCEFLVFLVMMMVGSCWVQKAEAFGTFGFDIHHRYSDPVKGILDLDGLPEKGSVEYYSDMAHRDHFFRGRHLADTTTPLTFAPAGNRTRRISAFGFLHYANVSVGTPPLSFLVALDTGSDLFWLPCDCTSCVRGIVTRNGRINFNIYSPNASSTSGNLPCNSTFCGQRRRQCSAQSSTCIYQVAYLSANTSSSGVLLDDVLHLETDDFQRQTVDAPITFGCGMIQTGAFLDGAAPNGLFGLGMDNISVPSILAGKGLAANSFSMCFGPDGVGRIIFGDKGTSIQGETPFNLDPLRPTYNISITQISVGSNTTDIEFTAIFDSGTSFTYLNEPAYSIITQNFDARVKETRHPPDSSLPFEYCYDLSANQTSFENPDLNLTMKGGSVFYVNQPIIITSVGSNGIAYCLAVVKSGDVNIIGQNFMTGYRIIFDREKMVLGWKESTCYEDRTSNSTSSTLPINPRNNATEAPSPTSVVPEATSGRGNGSPSASPNPSTPSPGNSASGLDSLTHKILACLFTFFGYYLIILSS